jgi:tripartite-type tricarboxylate transporter receptor subunit TctC
LVSNQDAALIAAIPRAAIVSSRAEIEHRRLVYGDAGPGLRYVRSGLALRFSQSRDREVVGGNTMKLSRRQSLHLAAVAAALPAVSRIARAQTYPSRPITMIVSATPGSTSDVIGRIVGERMRSSLGQPIIIENLSGADGNIGLGRADRAKPDGYTIDLGYLGNHVLNGAVYSLAYDVLNDFAPISPLVRTPDFLFARRTLASKDLNELIAWLKANPNGASVGVPAVGPRLVAAFFQKETGTHFSIVPYRSSTPAIQDLMAGALDLYFGPVDALPLLRAGSIKAYAVTSSTRFAAAPDVPTFAETGLPAVLFSAWYGLFAPKRTAQDIIGKLNAAAVEALADPTVRSRLGDFGLEIFPRERQTPEALSALVKADAEKWWPIIREFGIKAE